MTTHRCPTLDDVLSLGKVVQAVNARHTAQPPRKALYMALKPTKKFAAIVAVGATALAVTAAVAAPSLAASGPAPTTSGGRYLALGDSIPFGYRESHAEFPTNPQKPSTEIGYPKMVAQDLGLQLTNAACPGETTSSFITKGDQDNGCTTAVDGSPGWRTAGLPLHTSYSGSQLQFAVSWLKAHPRTKLVTLQIGANDGLRCRELNGGVCTNTPGGAQNLTNTLQTIYANLKTILTQITKKAGYQGQIVLVNYYSINSADASDPNGGTAQVAGLNAAEKGAASSFPTVKVANVFKQWAYASKFTPDGTTDTCEAGLETYVTDNEGNETCGIHPSNAGHALIATSVERVVTKS